MTKRWERAGGMQLTGLLQLIGQGNSSIENVWMAKITNRTTLFVFDNIRLGERMMYVYPPFRAVAVDFPDGMSDRQLSLGKSRGLSEDEGKELAMCRFIMMAQAVVDQAKEFRKAWEEETCPAVPERSENS